MNMKKVWITGIISAVLIGVVLTVLMTQYASAAFINSQQASTQLRSWQENNQWSRMQFKYHPYSNASTITERLRMRQCFENATFTVEEVSITGKFTDAEQGLIVLSVSGSNVVFRAPNRWIINGEVKSFIHLFVDDVVVKGHEVKIDALKVTATLRDGTSMTYYIAKAVTDLSSGAAAQAVMLTTSSGSQYSYRGQSA
jgi:cell division protein FtsL